MCFLTLRDTLFLNMLVSIDLSILLNNFTFLVPKGFLKQGPIFVNQIDKWIAVAVEITAA